MEVILATAFGYKVEIQRGEVEGGDDLIMVAEEVFNESPIHGLVSALLTSLHSRCSYNNYH